MEEPINTDETIGGRPIFSDNAPAQTAPRVVRMLEDLWPELGPPELHQRDDGGSAHVFAAKEGVEVRVETRVSGEVRVAVRVLPASKFMSVPDYAAVARGLGPQWCLAGMDDVGEPWLCLARHFCGEDLSPTRETAFRRQIEQFKEWADSVRPEQSGGVDEAALKAKYRKCEEVLAPIVPWGGAAGDAAEFHAWAGGVADLLAGGVSVGIAAETPLEQLLALGFVAAALAVHGGQTLGRVTKTGLATEQLLQAVFNAPGIVATHARLLRIGNNRYDMANESVNVLSSLASENRAALFFGTYGELQGAFHGGQGAENDPLRPAVCRFPEAELKLLVTFAVDEACRRAAMKTPAFQRDVSREVEESLASHDPGQARKVIQQTALRAVESKLNAGTPGAVAEFAKRLAACSETFGGVSKRARVRRLQAIQRHYQDRLTDPGLIPFLKSRLLGQDRAIEEQVDKLMRQALTCPIHQPLRVGALGPTGTGKSECAALIAEWLDVPFANIDAASMPDHHTAMAQLLGSGRGIIDSDQAGRLELLAKHHEGAVVEVSDADHAVPSVRGPITDVFLQVLQTGEAQAAKGHMFNCSNLILVFTLNLPDGKDERIFQPMGFANAPGLDDVRKDARRELKKLFSAAFWGRVGDPVLFGPLDDDVRTEIVRRVLQEAVTMAMLRMGISGACVEASTATARRLLAGAGAPAAGMGARGLLELAQQHAARAVMDFAGKGTAGGPGPFELVLNRHGRAALREATDTGRE